MQEPNPKPAGKSEPEPKTKSITESLAKFTERANQEDLDKKINTHPAGLAPKFSTEILGGTGEFVTPPFAVEEGVKVDKDYLLNMYSLDPEEWEITHLTVNSGNGWFRDAEGEDAISKFSHRYSGKFQSKILRREAAAAAILWEPPTMAAPPKVSVPKAKPFSINKKWDTLLVMPDQQFGYRLFEDGTGNLQPIHDEASVKLAHQISEYVRPKQIINVGDMGDFEQFGKYSKSKHFALTVQATINRMTEEFAIQTELSPEVVFISGNHDIRLEKAVAENIQAAYGLTQGRLPEDENGFAPVMSMRHLCRLEELGVKYCGPYPNGSHELNTGTLKFIHGTSVSSGGSTASAYINKATYQSVIFGHIHRVEMQARTIETPQGSKNIFAASPGTLAKTTGEVPSFHSADDENGEPSGTLENWQQGCLLVHYRPGQPYSEHLEMITFRTEYNTDEFSPGNVSTIALGLAFSQEIP